MSARAGTPSRGRPLVGVCVALVVAAGLLWAASALAWASPGRTSTGGAVAGSSAPSALTGVALLALAGIAAVVATSGVARRAVGVLLGVAGVVVLVATVGAVLAAKAVVGTGPLLAAGGGLVLAAVGSVVVARERRLARLGARYAAEGSRSAPADPDRAAWLALDEGRDPTADPAAADTTADPAAAEHRPDDPERAPSPPVLRPSTAPSRRPSTAPTRRPPNLAITRSPTAPRAAIPRPPRRPRVRPACGPRRGRRGGRGRSSRTILAGGRHRGAV